MQLTFFGFFEKKKKKLCPSLTLYKLSHWQAELITATWLSWMPIGTIL